MNTDENDDVLFPLVGLDEASLEDLLVGTESIEVDAEAYLRFLETGEGTDWHALLSNRLTTGESPRD